MGIFLNGAYQEILGDLHNLFGDTNAVHVRLTGDSYQIRHVVKGDSISEVLQYVGYTPASMVEAVRHQAEGALARGKLTNEQMRTLLRHYEQALGSYTYLTEED
jgi:arginine decarboxylase